MEENQGVTSPESITETIGSSASPEKQEGLNRHESVGVYLELFGSEPCSCGGVQMSNGPGCPAEAAAVITDVIFLKRGNLASLVSIIDETETDVA